MALLVAALFSAAPDEAEAAWGPLYPRVRQFVSAGPPDQSWLMDVTEAPGAREKAKVAVFQIKGDDVYQPVRAAVVRALRRKRLNVTAGLRPVDTAVQYRELSQALDMAVFVHGEMTGDGQRQTASIHLYSGVTGRRIASAKFSGPTRKIVGAIGNSLWSRTGGAITRACSTAARPRRLEREPLHIEAGTPLGNTTSSGEDT